MEAEVKLKTINKHYLGGNLRLIMLVFLFFFYFYFYFRFNKEGKS